MLVALAFREALGGRRLAVKLAFVTLALLVIAQWLIAPAVNVGLITNAPRPAVPSAATLGYPGARGVTFLASDGVRLAGWYVPGRNGAAVILLHGSHGTRTDTLAHLRMLYAAGYAVLAFDARGHGQSRGETNALGWSGARDIAGAVSFLKRQPGLDPRRIAALGLSMGAEEALRAAATGVPLNAIVADGAGASTLADDQLLPHGLGAVYTSVTWLTMRGTGLVSGETEPTGLSRLVGRIRVPALLIASNASGERTIDQIYRDRIGRTASLWYLPDAGHTARSERPPGAVRSARDRIPRRRAPRTVSTTAMAGRLDRRARSLEELRCSEPPSSTARGRGCLPVPPAGHTARRKELAMSTLPTPTQGISSPCGSGNFGGSAPSYDAPRRLVHAVLDGPGDLPHPCAERRSHHSGTAEPRAGRPRP